MMLVPRRNNFDLFDNFFEDDFFHHPAPRKEHQLMKTDVRETNDKFIVDIDLPGYEKENISLSLNNGYLEINAKTEKETNENDEEKYIRRERYVGECSRSFFVGEDTDYEDIDAEFKNGILTIEIKKKVNEEESDEPKQIEIR